MSLQESLLKIKPFYTLILLLVLASIFGAFWRFSVLEESHTPIKIEYSNVAQTGAVAEAGAVTSSGAVIGVSTSKKYYFPWCGTIKRVKPQNQVSFSSASAARAAGYLPGGNCKGLQ